MKEVINYGEARRQQILKGFATADEAADEPIEKARHGVYADNAQNRRLQRVGQEYGQAAKEDPEGEGQEGGMPEGNVSLQNHARQASEEALTKVANDPQADPEMRKVATAELERRGVSVRAKNKNGDTSLRNGLADGDAKSASTFEGMGFRQMDDQDLQQYAGVEDASHAFIKQIGGDEDGFDLVVTKTSEGYRVDKYPYADVDNFESVTVKEIGDVEGAASKFGDPDAKGKGGKADAASLVDSFNAMAEGNADFDAKSFKSFVKEKGGKAVKEIADAIRSFVFDQCKATPNWNMENFIADQIELIRKQVGNRKVLLALSGGVDSSVAAALINKAIGGQLTCIFVNNGLLRKNEAQRVQDLFGRNFRMKLVYVDATERFMTRLKDVAEPERKRKIIGHEFVQVFDEASSAIEDAVFLAQGTTYPDVIESVPIDGNPAAMIKSHHNVGGLPEDLQFELVEPLKMLFKDEVRACGKALGLPDNMVFRQPFPGPGLGVRCLGAITRDRLEAVREADAILREEFQKAGLDKKVWQYFTVVPDFKSVGVRDNARSFEWPVIIRAVNTVDAMTATIEPVDWHILMKITDRILKEVKNVNRVCYDMSPKPNATIEWE